MSEDDIALLKSMFDLPKGDSPEPLASGTVDTSTTAEIMPDHSGEELPEAVLELIAILNEEFEELHSQLEILTESSTDPDTEVEVFSTALKNYADNVAGLS